MNYIAEIISQIKKNFFEKNEKYFNIVFVFKDFLTKDTVPFDSLAEKLGGKAGDTFPAGIAPRLTFARTEAYWLLVSFPFLFLALDKLGVSFKKRFIVVNPEAVTTDGGRAYIAHPLELKHKGNIASALKQIKHFIDHGEDPDYAQDLLFDVKKFFHIQPTEGYLPIDENCLIFVGSTADDHHKKAALVVALQKAEDSGAMVVEKPRYWLPDYMFRNYGFGDAKSMAHTLLPHHYPESCEGRIIAEARQFLRRHRHIVIKPSSGSNGFGVEFFDARECEGEALQEKLKEFDVVFERYLNEYKEPTRIIVQRYLDGINQTGEVRLFIYGGKILPVGIRLMPETENALCKIFLNAKVETFLLTPDYLDIAVEFIKKSRHIELNYFGLDIIRDIGPDGFEKLYVTEANFMVSGFFDHIASQMEANIETITAHIASLPDSIRPFMEGSHLNATVYKIFYQFLMKQAIRKGLPEANAQDLHAAIAQIVQDKKKNV